MKNNNKWLGLIAATFFLLTVLNSCIKNHIPLETDFSQAQSIIELPNAGFKALGLNITDAPSQLHVYVNLGGPVVAPKDLTITLALDPAGLAAYDTANGALFTMLPDSAFTVPSYTVTIKKGQRLDSLVFSVFSKKVDLSLANALAFKITDASGLIISQNFQSVIFSIVVKNDWDGLYTVTGWFFHPSAGRAIKTTKSLNTVNAVRSQAGVGDLGNQMQFEVINNLLVNWSSADETSSVDNIPPLPHPL
jgi:hypothetical protein